MAVAALLVIGGSMALAAKPALEGVKCVMQPTKAANESKSLDWKKGKIYFCCDNCPKAFTKDKEKNAAKANAQLVATKQYEQHVCPISGAKLDESTAIEVRGTKVTFCCKNCKAKVEKAEGDEQLDLVFGEKAFEKGKYEPVKESK
jgi:YHS domain-containing protein